MSEQSAVQQQLRARWFLKELLSREEELATSQMHLWALRMQDGWGFIAWHLGVLG